MSIIDLNRYVIENILKYLEVRERHTFLSVSTSTRAMKSLFPAIPDNIEIIIKRLQLRSLIILNTNDVRLKIIEISTVSNAPRPVITMRNVPSGIAEKMKDHTFPPNMDVKVLEYDESIRRQSGLAGFFCCKIECYANKNAEIEHREFLPPNGFSIKIHTEAHSSYKNIFEEIKPFINEINTQVSRRRQSRKLI